jgi:hypothetical protein
MHQDFHSKLYGSRTVFGRYINTTGKESRNNGLQTSARLADSDMHTAFRNTVLKLLFLFTRPFLRAQASREVRASIE